MDIKCVDVRFILLAGYIFTLVKVFLCWVDTINCWKQFHYRWPTGKIHLTNGHLMVGIDTASFEIGDCVWFKNNNITNVPQNDATLIGTVLN